MSRRHPAGAPFRLIGSLVFVLACVRPPGPTIGDLETDAPGLSGLTVDSNGFLWAVPEEQRSLIRIDPNTGASEAIPLEGVEEGLETESITFLGEGRFALGTELNGRPRPHDDILFARIRDGVAHVEETVACPYGMWGLEGQHNHGIEGMCVVDGALWVTAEIIGLEGERRFAPLARRGPGGQWTSHRVWLTSDEGKLAALSCHAGEHGEAVIFAVERHFGILRILRMQVPASTLPTDLEPVVLANLDAWVSWREPSPNLEGLEVLPDGRAVMILDNHYGGRIQRDNALYFLQLP